MPLIQRSYRIRCYPNGAQVRMLNQWFGSVRFLWNHALEMRTKAWQRRKERVTGVDISRRVTKIKKLPRFAWLAKVPCTCLTQCLRDQDKAFANFFRRVKTGEAPGYPKWKTYGMAGGLRFQDVSPKWVKGLLVLPKLGPVKLAEDLPSVACPDTVTLKRQVDGRYYVSFAAMVEIETLPATTGAVGIDLGLTHLATLSTGEKLPNPRRLANRLRYLRQQQRCLSRRQKGSKRRERQRLRVGRAHGAVANQRNHAMHEATTKLVRQHQIICIEDLFVKGMNQHPKLARQLADAAFGEFRRQLEYKAKWYGRTLVAVDRWYPSSKTCSCCGHVLDELRLDQREWMCLMCGTEHDRDINAAKNVLAEGLRQLAGGEHRDLRVDGAVVDAPWKARTGQLTNACVELV